MTPQFPQTIDDLRTKSSIADLTVQINNQIISTNISENSVVNAMTAVYDVTNQLQQTIAAMRDHSDNNSQSYPYQRPPQQQSHPNQWQPQQNQKHFSRQEHFYATRPGAHQTSRVCRNCGGKSCFSKFSCPARGTFCQKCKRYIITLNISVLITFFKTMVIHKRNSRRFLESNLRIGTW